MRLTKGLIVFWAVGLLLTDGRRLREWQSDVTIWTAAVRTDPGLLRPHANLASALMVQGRYRDADAEWTAATTLLDHDRWSGLYEFERRYLGLHFAADLVMQHRLADADVWAHWAGCHGEKGDWICPATPSF